jgi:hypothetical protein
MVLVPGAIYGSASQKNLVRKGGLEPPRLAAPDPKSGASANSATFARENVCIVNRAAPAAKFCHSKPDRESVAATVVKGIVAYFTAQAAFVVTLVVALIVSVVRAAKS